MDWLEELTEELDPDRLELDHELELWLDVEIELEELADEQWLLQLELETEDWLVCDDDEISEQLDQLELEGELRLELVETLEDELETELDDSEELELELAELTELEL